MPDDVGLKIANPAEAANERGRRSGVIAFIADAESEAVLRQGLEHAAPEGIEIHRSNGRGAIAALRKMSSPRVLIVDIAGEEQPLSVLGALSEVVEPDIKVLVVGDRQDMTLYRQLTRDLGVGEYLYKPLSAEVVAQHFGPFIAGGKATAAQPSGGRVITVTGSCGGAGASTVAANLAWHLAVEGRRHTVLLDPDLHTGTASMLLSARTGSGLRTALETPQRVDDLFLERIAQPAAERLSVIAGEEKLTELPTPIAGSGERLLQALRRHYNYVVVDLPFVPLPYMRELLAQARQRVVVTEPTLSALRDTIRLLALPMGAHQARRPVVVLNKLGAPGMMTRAQAEEALQFKVDLAVPFLPRVVISSAMMGTPAVKTRGAFRDAIQLLGREVAATAAPDLKLGRRGLSLARLFGRAA